MKPKCFVVGLCSIIRGRAMTMASRYQVEVEAALLAKREYGQKDDETKNEKRKLDEGNRQSQENKRFQGSL
ncbi:hypothetical protein Tco_1328040 [Tanacetum coccineum]